MGEADALHGVIEKFVAPDINLSHHDAIGPDGRKLLGLTNLGMGYVFEELTRKFNEENNEEADEHFTPREVIQDGLLHGNLVPRGPGRSQAIFFATAGRIVQCPRGQILKESRK